MAMQCPPTIHASPSASAGPERSDSGFVSGGDTGGKLVRAVAFLSRIVAPIMVMLCLMGNGHAAGPDVAAYQVQFPASPKDGLSALLTLDDRAKAVLAAMACGSEVDFGKIQTTANEDSTAFLIAKLEWATGHPDRQGTPRFNETCVFTRYFAPTDLCNLLDFPITCTTASLILARRSFEAGFAIKFFHYCRDYTVTLSTPDPGGTFTTPSPLRPPISFASDMLQVTFAVSVDCMIEQINTALLGMSVNGLLGSSGIPCHLNPWTLTEGEWDVAVRNLTRIAYLNARNVTRNGREVLHAPALAHLQNDLLTASEGPAAESYPVTGCGNSEEHTGSTPDRIDERSWMDTPFWQTIGDILWFLLKLVVIIILVYLAAVILVAALGAALAGVVLTVAAAAVLVGATGSYPESENHLLMINTSKFLKNQMILADAGNRSDSDGANRFRKDQSELKDWLLHKMRGIMYGDFIEYNSRPYNRYSIFAIQNLADFATDDDLGTGARMVLDYMTAKFAVGSQQGRRFVPFRRKREAMGEYIDVTASQGINGLFDLIHAGDHQIGLGLMYAGQVQQMRDNFVSFGAAGHGIYAATSNYLPEEFVVDLAIKKEDPTFQRMRHTTGEVYSSGHGFLISAGGLVTDYAYVFSVFGGKSDDKGVAMPTTLFLSKSQTDDPKDRPYDFGVGRTTLNELIRIDGHRPEASDTTPSYDHNLCVWDGFACGLNVVVPESAAFDDTIGFPSDSLLLGESGPCLSKGPAGSPAEWDFIDSRRCAAYRNASRVFIAIYRGTCPASNDSCADNFGFFEVVDAAKDDDFDAFMTKVIAANPGTFAQSAGNTDTSATYHSVRGQAIEFQVDSNSGRSGIMSVNGVTQHDFGSWWSAEGSSALGLKVKTPIQSHSDGHVLITNWRANKTLDLDFRDYLHPVRTVK